MLKKFSLIKKFTILLTLFVAITVSVMTLLVTSYNEPINFAFQEKHGNTYQRPVERLLSGLTQHHILSQRIQPNEVIDNKQIQFLQSFIKESFNSIIQVNKELGETLQFTKEGLTSRKREQIQLDLIQQKWVDLKAQLSSLDSKKNKELHSQLIADLRTMITHLGDTSKLILDPDLDSYYLMDITLLALPQTQDRIQNAIIELEPIIRRQAITPEERLQASVLAALMKESDLNRITSDFQTVLIEDPNFFGISPSLQSELTPQHSKFVEDYTALINTIDRLGRGDVEKVDSFLRLSEKALNTSFAYWDFGVNELDKLLTIRAASYQRLKYESVFFSIVGILLALGIAWLFIRHLIQNLKDILNTLNHSSEQVSTASTQSASSATQLSESATEQASSLQETMSSILEISAMVNQNAESATQTKTKVEANQITVAEGTSSVTQVIEAINEIEENNSDIMSQMEVTNSEFIQVVKIISEIGTKANIINEIVFQTKLLSFNASVEAARAGEHGKGFAVVADEVGKLAQMSGNAAQEITNLLMDSTLKVNNIIDRTKARLRDLVKAGKDKLSKGHSTADKCQKALDKISSISEDLTSMVAAITNASKEQALGVEEINKAISQLNIVTQQNSSVAQQSSTQADHLHAEAAHLSKAVHNLLTFVEGKRAG